jgi:hypothetical protein
MIPNLDDYYDEDEQRAIRDALDFERLQQQDPEAGALIALHRDQYTDAELEQIENADSAAQVAYEIARKADGLEAALSDGEVSGAGDIARSCDAFDQAHGFDTPERPVNDDEPLLEDVFNG